MNERFQFTPARGGRHISAMLLTVASGFNSRPREAGDAPGAARPAPREVSIHARARRATRV